MELNVSEMGFSEVNERMRQTDEREITLNGCIGQRFLAAGTDGKYVSIHGIAGNALGEVGGLLVDAVERRDHQRVDATEGCNRDLRERAGCGR